MREVPVASQPGFELASDGGGFNWTDLSYRDILVLSPTPTFPQDQGNRKRIHVYCKALQAKGARVHFVHYPMEWWFSFTPQDHLQAMARAWDTYHQLPSTRPLHAPAKGMHHEVDEWWDPAIGDYLAWLFQRGRYDAFIVNYTFLSKAFEYAPAHVLKILDTHDRFSGRREMLESQGIEPEFFYTTVEREAIALDRADLIWAIKEEEAQFFREISSSRVITFPHVEPVRSIPRARTAEDDGYLVVGMIGARNAINVRNARAFVDEVLPYFKRALAPIKIRLAGGMCDLIMDLAERPGVELIGRVQSIDEFYSAVDVVIVPLAFSTGLKIKAVEAFAGGLPVIANRHALEGIPVRHPHHLCRDNEEIARHCIDIAFDVDQLERMAESTHETYLRLLEQAAEGLASTVRHIVAPTSFVVMVNRAFFELSHPYREHVVQVLHHIKDLGEVILYCDGGLPADQATLFDAFNLHNQFCKLVVPADLAQAAARETRGVSDATGVSLGAFHYVSSLESLVSKRPRVHLWVFDLPEPMRGRMASVVSECTGAYVRKDLLMLLGEDLVRLAEEELDGNPRVTWLGAVAGLGVQRTPDVGRNPKSALPVPFWRQLPWQLDSRFATPVKQVLLLVGARDSPLAQGLRRLFRDVFSGWVAPAYVVSSSFDSGSYGLSGADSLRSDNIQTVRQFMSSFESLHQFPSLVIDLCPDDPGFAVVRETLNRLGTYRVLVRSQFVSPGRLRTPVRHGGTRECGTVGELAEAIVELVGHVEDLGLPYEALRREAEKELGGDASWGFLTERLIQEGSFLRPRL